MITCLIIDILQSRFLSDVGMLLLFHREYRAEDSLTLRPLPVGPNPHPVRAAPASPRTRYPLYQETMIKAHLLLQLAMGFQRETSRLHLSSLVQILQTALRPQFHRYLNGNSPSVRAIEDIAKLVKTARLLVQREVRLLHWNSLSPEPHHQFRPESNQLRRLGDPATQMPTHYSYVEIHQIYSQIICLMLIIVTVVINLACTLSHCLCWFFDVV